MNTRKPDLANEVVAGLAVFFSMSYVAFANPIILSTAGKCLEKSGDKCMAYAGMPMTPVFFATCIMAALATAVSGTYARSPAALAPGLALSGALAQFLQFNETTIGWESALIVCGFCGLFLLFASITPRRFRRKVVDSIPPTIKLAVTGGIGAVLAENALRLVANHPGTFSSSVLMFAGGLAIIVFGYVILGIIASKTEATSPDSSRFIGLLGRSSLFISVPAVAVLAYYINPTSAQAVGSESLWVWSHSTVTMQQAFQGAFRFEAIGLFFLILYILFADIVGSPYHLALDDRNYVHSDGFSAAEEQTIQRSFVVDSVSNVIAPIVGTSPVVYYAENFAGKVLGGRSPIVAYVAALGFALLFAFGIGLAWFGKSINYFMPGISVAPVLFFVGIMIISKALWPSPSGSEVDESSAASSTTQLGQFIDLGRRLPAAIAIVATPAAGFEIGVAAGILSYSMFTFFLPEVDSRDEAHNSKLGWLALIAAVSVYIKVRLMFG